jgi:spermidine/putrescine transport system substrate-binding protein
MILGLWGIAFAGILYTATFLLTRHKARELSVCTWGDVFDPQLIEQFEKETGITVKFTYYASNEELLTMLKTTQGTTIDMVVPSDYALDSLRKKELLKPLDKSRLSFLDRLNPLLLNHYFDPENKYSIPFVWEVHGLGIDKEALKPRVLKEPSWALLFEESPIRQVMTNDPLDAFSIAAQYLFGSVEPMTQEKLCKVQELLIYQRKYVEAYSSLRPDYFLVTKNFAVVVAPSSIILRAMQTYPYIDFVLPREGGFIVIENLALLSASRKEDLAYAFINFLYRKEILEQHFTKFFYFPPTVDIVASLSIDEKMRDIMISSTIFKKFSFFKHVIKEDCLNMLWVKVKTP